MTVILSGVGLASRSEVWRQRSSAVWRLAMAAPGVLLGVAAGAIAIGRGFDGLYGQDAYAYFDYSVTSVRNSLLHAQPLEPFYWPPGFPLVVALASLLIGPTPLAGQLVSLLMGALVPVLTAALAREMWPHDLALALLAGAMVGVSGQLWQSSVVVMADTTGLALATFGAWALAQYARGGRGAWLVAAGAALACAALARWIYGVVAVPFAAYALWIFFERRRLPTEAFIALAVAAVILLPVVGPLAIGMLRSPGEAAPFGTDFQVYSWSPLNAPRREFFTADGHLEYALPNGLYYVVAPANLAFFGPLLAIWIPVGIVAARAWLRRDVVLIGGWAASVFVFHAGAPWQNFRFTLAYLPPLAILAAAGLLLAWRQVPHPARLLVAACAGGGLLLAFGASIRLVERFIDTKDQDLALVHWVAGQTPSDAQLITFGPTLAFRHYSALRTFDLFDTGPSGIDDIVARSGSDYVLVDESSIETQWRDQGPATSFHRLRDGYGLERLGTMQGYTLYRVGTSGP